MSWYVKGQLSAVVGEEGTFSFLQHFDSTPNAEFEKIASVCAVIQAQSAF